MWGIGIRLNLDPWFRSMKKLRSAFSSRALSLNTECREPVTRSARSYKQQQMATYEVSTDETFVRRTKQSASLGGSKIPGAQKPVPTTATMSGLWSPPSACLACSEGEKSIGRKQNRTSLYERQKQTLWPQLELRQESQKSITWHQGLNFGESGKIMAVFDQKSLQSRCQNEILLLLHSTDALALIFLLSAGMLLNQQNFFISSTLHLTTSWGLTGSHDWASGR